MPLYKTLVIIFCWIKMGILHLCKRINLKLFIELKAIWLKKVKEEILKILRIHSNYMMKRLTRIWINYHLKTKQLIYRILIKKDF